MAIGTDSLIDFFGTQVSVDDGTTSTISNNAFSAVGDITTFTNADDAPSCVMVLQVQFGTAPADGSVINIYAQKLNVEGTNDSPVPDGNNLDQYIGSFVVDGTVGSSTDMFLVTNWMTLPNHKTSQEYDFYIENKTGQTISANWNWFITPSTKGPHA